MKNINLEKTLKELEEAKAENKMLVKKYNEIGEKH